MALAHRIAAGAERLSTWLGPGAMRRLAHFHKWVSNPVLRLWAGYVPRMAVIEHRGRRTGQPYRTPVMAWVDHGAFAVVLNYGPTSDWVRNVLAAGSAGIAHRGKHFRLVEPRVVAVDQSTLAALVTTGHGRCALEGRLVAG